MEYIPSVEQRGGRLFVTGRHERRDAHSANPVPHPTTLILPVTPDGRFVLVDKYDKSAFRAKLYDLPLAAKRPELDCFGGHMEYGSLSEEDIASGIGGETFLACALRELSEEYIDTPEPSRMKLLGEIKNDEPGNVEYAHVYTYELPDDGPDCAQDNVGAAIIPLSVTRLTRAELLALPPEKTAKGLAMVLKLL